MAGRSPLPMQAPQPAHMIPSMGMPVAPPPDRRSSRGLSDCVPAMRRVSSHTHPRCLACMPSAFLRNGLSIFCHSSPKHGKPVYLPCRSKSLMKCSITVIGEVFFLGGFVPCVRVRVWRVARECMSAPASCARALPPCQTQAHASTGALLAASGTRGGHGSKQMWCLCIPVPFAPALSPPHAPSTTSIHPPTYRGLG